MTDPGHVPVLLDDVLELLDPRPGDVVADATVGRGGHSVALSARIGPEGTLVGLDVDEPSLAYAASRVADLGAAPLLPVRETFVRLPAVLAERGLRAAAVLADLGFSSAQMDDPARGFGFRADGPLDMRLDPAGPVTAAELLAASSEARLAEIIREYGEEPLARAIARKLVEKRRAEPIESTAQLAQVVLEAYGRRARESRMHPATRTFMALRIAVNDELGALQALLDQIAREARRPDRTWLTDDARIAIIAFHSLEDRLVKHAFADLARAGAVERLTPRPRTAGAREVAENPRARSAKLRAVRLLPPTPAPR